MTTTEKIKGFWNDYLLTLAASERDQEYFEADSWGNSPELADRIAQLIASGIKTTTSCLLWDQQQKQWTPEKLGDKSIVLDSQNNPVCITETVEIFIRPFNEVEADFVYHYGEGDRSMNFWNKNMWEYYQEECRALGRVAEEDMPMICQVFKLIYKS
jgi:uncharacterized protein YhfF